MRGIVFDLDGTLTDSLPGLVESLRRMHDAVGWEQPDVAILRSWLGPPLTTLLAEAGHSPADIDRAMVAFRDSQDSGAIFNSTLYPGISELIAELDAAGVPLALATHKLQLNAEQVIDHYGLRSRFRGVHGRLREEDGHSKAAVIDRAVQSLGLPTTDVAMVGDRVNDVASAREVGVHSIGVAYGYGGREELEGAGADEVVASVDELRGAILRWVGY